LSLYADDAAIFINPTVTDVNNIKEILVNFGRVTGLTTNVQKSSVSPIRCDGLDLTSILAAFPASRAAFPIFYLGLPLSLGRLKRVDFQPLVDKASSKLANWMGKFFTTAGRATLVKAVLSSQPVYYLSALNAPAETIEDIDRRRKRFLWTGTDQIAGGKCKVAWPKACRPTRLGGLEILDLKKFARALQLRWLWQEWKSPDKPWVGMPIPCTEEDRRLFNSATTITVGNGELARFWDSAWLQGLAPKQIAPSIYAISKKRGRTVANATLNDAWVLDIDISRLRSASQIHEFSFLWERLRGFQLSPELPDSIVWKLTKHGQYTAASAYEAQFTDVPSSPMEHLIWRVWAPPKCKFFSWLAFQNRLWTADRLMKRRRPNQKICMLCRSVDETGLHMFTQCRYSLSVWQDIFNWVSPHVPPRTDWSTFTSLEEWWSAIGSMPGAPLKGWRSLLILVCWELWKERNARIFRRTFIHRGQLVLKIKEEARCWILAGANYLRDITNFEE
jgi:hypothetical protein